MNLPDLSPYKLVAEVVVIGALGLGAAWGFHLLCEHQREIGREEVRAEDARVSAIQSAAERKLEGVYKDNSLKAESNATARDQTLAPVLAASAQSADRLRSTLASYTNGMRSASPETDSKTIATLATVLGDCQARYREVAKAADGHASDVQTFDEAFPVAPPK